MTSIQDAVRERDAGTDHGATSCSGCAMSHLCMPSSGVSGADLAKLDDVIKTRRMVKRGESLYRAGDPFRNLYAVRAGSFKTVVRHDDGREQVTGFYLAGESFGMDGISTDEHSQHAIALEDGAVCLLPFHLLECLSMEVRAIQHHLHRMLSSEIVRESGLMLMLGNMTASERLAALLLNLSKRMQARGYSPSAFVLRMTREDIGCHLGLTIETVSRTFSQFQRMGLIQVRNRQIRLLDPEGLAKA